MAENETPLKSLDDSFNKTSGDDELFCDPCLYGNKRVEVKGYCPICRENLCKTCLDVHRNQKITMSHVIVNESKIPKQQELTSTQLICVQVCKTHSPEIVRFYCKTHDVTGCGDCMTLNHAKCIREKVQDISEDFQATEEFRQIQQKLKQLHKNLEIMKDLLRSNLKSLDTAYSDILDRIAFIRKEINDHLDQMQKDITDEVAEMKRKDETQIQARLKENEAMQSKLENIQEQIQSGIDCNVNTVFVVTKQGKEMLNPMEDEFNKMKHQSEQQQQQQQYEILPSTEIDCLLAGKIPFGKLSRQSAVANTLIPRGTLNIKSNTDTDDCLISDCSLLDVNKMIVTDASNRQVKLVDIRNNTVLTSYSTSSEPSNIAVIGDNSVAITLPEKKRIELLEVTSTITKKLDIELTSVCFGIAYKDNMFAVSYLSSGIVEILSLKGELRHTIQPKLENASVLYKPFYVTFGGGNKTIIVSDSITNVVCEVAFDGQVLKSYTHDLLNQPRGFLLTTDGFLFVCSSGNGCIHVVSPDFKRSKLIMLTDDKYEVHPVSITHDKRNHRAYISYSGIDGGEMANTIQVYEHAKY